MSTIIVRSRATFIVPLCPLSWAFSCSFAPPRSSLLLRRRQCLDRHQHVFLAHDQVSGVQRGQLEAVAVGDSVGGAGFNAVAAKDAAVVVDVENLGVALRGGDANGVGVIGGLDINAIRGARSGA